MVDQWYIVCVITWLFACLLVCLRLHVLFVFARGMQKCINVVFLHVAMVRSFITIPDIAETDVFCLLLMHRTSLK